MPLFKHIIVTFALIITCNLHAKTVVLIHGFTANSSIWNQSGLTKPLLETGWINAGNYTVNQWGILAPTKLSTTADIFVTVDLPSTANLQTQEGILLHYLRHLYTNRLEPITLVGHSAGGVVARLYALDPRRQPINGLITIASPHLGTPAANIASLAGSSPVGMIASMAGIDTLQDSRGLFADLTESKPNNFLGWMNQQVHPDIHYASIIRNNNSITKIGKFDFVVPTSSQNMNNIWALQNRSGVAFSTSNHAININDGKILVNILNYIQ